MSIPVELLTFIGVAGVLALSFVPKGGGRRRR